jgi:hypothetical protein
LEARVFNGAADAPRIQVALGDGGEEAVAWNLRIGSGQKPWAAVIVPDGDVHAGREVYGAPDDPVGA